MVELALAALGGAWLISYCQHKRWERVTSAVAAEQAAAKRQADEQAAREKQVDGRVYL